MSTILETTFYGNSIESWGLAALIAVAVVAGYRMVARLVIRRLAKLAARTTTVWDDLIAHVLHKTKAFALLLVAIYVGSLTLTLPDRLRAVLEIAAVLAIIVQGGIWVTTGLVFWLDQYAQRDQEDRARVTTMSALGFVGKLVVWAAVLLLALDNIGVDITALVAGLGIGGIAVALALQNILGDLFASLSIVLDKPFVIGDFVIIDDYLGSVEHVGLKTTRVRSLSGEQLVFSNTDLLRSRLRNYGRMYERRIVFSVGVTYQTPREKLQKIPAILRQAVEAQQKTRFDRAHFAKYGAFSIDFETVYYVLDPSYNIYMDTQQAINLYIHEQFEENGIEFAYPTQTLFLVKEAG